MMPLRGAVKMESGVAVFQSEKRAAGPQLGEPDAKGRKTFSAIGKDAWGLRPGSFNPLTKS